jgi:FkbM family methyltransferase
MMDRDRAFFVKFFSDYSIRRVFDIGANVGDKSSVFLEIVDQVICVEADPAMAFGLRSRFAFQKRLVVKNVAIGADVGIARLFRKNHSGFNTLSLKWSDAANQLGVSDDGTIEVPVTTLDQLIATHGHPDYIKIDIEGYELPAIRGLTCSIQALSFEANIPVFLAETIEIVKRLTERQPSIRFNLRISDATSFELSKFVDGADLIDKLTEMSPFTCDVFAIDTAL